jgi:hypothetical protein
MAIEVEKQFVSMDKSTQKPFVYSSGGVLRLISAQAIAFALVRKFHLKIF